MQALSESVESQSLWNRAMSFDLTFILTQAVVIVSIPLEQGNVFRPSAFAASVTVLDVSIPLEQGNVFRLYLEDLLTDYYTSQSLWNRAMSFDLPKNNR